MKNILAVALFITILISSAGTIAGLYMLIHNITTATIITSGKDLFLGFEIFSLGAISLLAITILYFIAKLHEAFLSISKTLQNTISLMETNQEALSPKFPSFTDILGNFKGSAQFGIVDENGNVESMGTSEFNSAEEFLAKRDEILGQMFGIKKEDVKKKLEDMSVEELKQKEQEAVKNQEFEKASILRDAIKRKE